MNTTMTISECREIRETIVNAIRPEWKKVKANPWDGVATKIPDAPGARLYWSARNGSRNVRQHQANVTEDARCRLGEAYSPDGAALVSEADAEQMRRCLEKLRQAEAELDGWLEVQSR